jgi:hypothetical protein
MTVVAVLDCQLHGATEEQHRAVHEALGSLPNFNFIGIHCTWEIEKMPPDKAAIIVELAFLAMLLEAKVDSADFKVYAAVGAGELGVRTRSHPTRK